MKLIFTLLSLMVLPLALSGQAPASVFPDLTEFKVEYPIDNDEGDYEGVEWEDRDNPHIKSHSVNISSSYTPQGPYGDYFYLDGSELVFKSHCAGALTSPNAYPRTELRQLINGQNSFWSYDDEHELNVRFTINHLPDLKQEVCVVQLKGTNTPWTTSGTDEVLRVEYRQDGNSGWHLTINESSGPSNVLDYTIGEEVKIRVYVHNNEVTLEMENLDNGDTYTYLYDSDYSDGYIKAGAYTQSSIWEQKNGVGDEEPDAYSEVRFTELVLGPSCSNPIVLAAGTDDYLNAEEVHLTTDATITATNLVANDADITYDAAQGVILDAGFEIEIGAEFEAKIDGCN